MKVLTIKQPYATLIIKGFKKYEFRTWKTKYRGKILIHAGKGIDKEAMKRYEYLNLEYPSGYIIGQVSIADCILVDENFINYLKDKDNLIYHNITKYNSDWIGYAFKLDDVKEIKHIKINGSLSFWNYNC